MSLSHEHVGIKILAKIKIYNLSRAKLLITVWDEIPCMLGLWCVLSWRKPNYYRVVLTSYYLLIANIFSLAKFQAFQINTREFYSTGLINFLLMKLKITLSLHSMLRLDAKAKLFQEATFFVIIFSYLR